MKWSFVKFSSVVLVIAAVVLAGCGGGSEAAEAPAPGDGGEPEASSVDDSVAAGGDAADTAEPETTTVADTTEPPEFESVESIGMTLAWRVVGDSLEVELTGPTTGWIAVGFKPTRAMRDANILIGYVDGSETVMTDQFGVTMTSHRPDDQLGGDSHAEVVSGSESGGATTITFRIPLDSGDEYDQPLTAGETVRVILAYGPDGSDDVTSYHADRSGIDITI